VLYELIYLGLNVKHVLVAAVRTVACSKAFILITDYLSCLFLFIIMLFVCV